MRKLKVGWAMHVACTGELKRTQYIYLDNPKAIAHLHTRSMYGRAKKNSVHLFG